MELSVAKNLLVQAASLAKITVSTLSQHTDSLDHSLLRLSSDSIRLTSTNDSIGSDINISLLKHVPELLDDTLSIWVKPGLLLDLVSNYESDDFNFIVDTRKSFIATTIGSAKLHTPIRSNLDWPEIDPRFIHATPTQAIHGSLLKELISFNKIFLSGGHDPSKNLVEIRSSMGISTDRIKFGFFQNDELEGLEVKLPGDQLASLESSLVYLPNDLLIGSSDAYTLLSGESAGLSVILGIVKTARLLGPGLDEVPAFEESEQYSVNRIDLMKMLNTLSSVSIKVDPRVKISVTSDQLKLTVSNELSQESTDIMMISRTRGDLGTPVTIIVPQASLAKALKAASSENVLLSMEAKSPKYLKMSEDRGHAKTYCIFQSLSKLRAQ